MGDMLSQEEIDALLKGNASTPSSDSGDQTAEVRDLDENEKDALGEIGNISMGTSATTLFTLLGQKVTITTPQVSVMTIEELKEQYPIPFVAVEVSYKEGLEGINLLILKEDDVKIITDLMMGGDGRNFTGELTELHLSAISEAMNQMVGSASTSLSEMFHTKIDINPPAAFAINFSTKSIDIESRMHDDRVVKIAFKMVIGDIIDSEIMQLLPVSFAKNMVNHLFESSHTTYTNSYEDVIDTKSVIEPKGIIGDRKEHVQSQAAAPNYGEPVYRREPVNVQPVQFQSFDEQELRSERENISLIKDVPLEVTVELGRTSKKISEILEFAPGTVIELDKLVGEPLDLLVNGQYVAKGEVVVIDENYGIRVTDIINSSKRINKVK
ncbi:flagellar motor switch phosphatase FliY [Geosporobacter ferrireducens]|uniref:Flagellar motor switch phosphatase FliY n=1 Tax=Geosporobacter ferrireducens TaxID=1424294 RepID=A0A1D8GBI9_9FIRM|nr:flagellar motor switch phosphatase FliY [Geosporobacter ferrireducens]AOT68270.1 flagellar motor switch phosphatase FliY [Geosporobacter ferrireducens]MTI57308.1 flagellar motor switch phosphatase FliY [Geosporobacter ferrireducens]